MLLICLWRHKWQRHTNWTTFFFLNICRVVYFLQSTIRRGIWNVFFGRFSWKPQKLSFPRKMGVTIKWRLLLVWMTCSTVDGVDLWLTILTKVCLWFRLRISFYSALKNTIFSPSFWWPVRLFKSPGQGHQQLRRGGVFSKAHDSGTRWYAYNRTHTHRQTDRQTDRQTASQPASQAGRQAGRQTCMHTSTYIYIYVFLYYIIVKCTYLPQFMGRICFFGIFTNFWWKEFPEGGERQEDWNLHLAQHLRRDSHGFHTGFTFREGCTSSQKLPYKVQETLHCRYLKFLVIYDLCLQFVFVVAIVRLLVVLIVLMLLFWLLFLQFQLLRLDELTTEQWPKRQTGCLGVNPTVFTFW